MYRQIEYDFIFDKSSTATATKNSILAIKFKSSTRAEKKRATHKKTTKDSKGQRGKVKKMHANNKNLFKRDKSSRRRKKDGSDKSFEEHKTLQNKKKESDNKKNSRKIG
jgi:hypothetical protein